MHEKSEEKNTMSVTQSCAMAEAPGEHQVRRKVNLCLLAQELGLEDHIPGTGDAKYRPLDRTTIDAIARFKTEGWDDLSRAVEVRYHRIQDAAAFFTKPTKFSI